MRNLGSTDIDTSRVATVLVDETSATPSVIFDDLEKALTTESEWIFISDVSIPELDRLKSLSVLLEAAQLADDVVFTSPVVHTPVPL